MTIAADTISRGYSIPGKDRIHVVEGRESVLQMQGFLAELCARTGQLGAMDDLAYYLDRPKFKNKVPCLVLICSGEGSRLPTTSGEIKAAALLYQYQVLGVSCKVFVADYHGGDRTILAPLPVRAQVASIVCATLLRRGAFVVQLSYKLDSEVPDLTFLGSNEAGSHWRWSWGVRQTRETLPLAETFDETLSTLGKRTRRNMRAERRNAEEQLGYSFVVNPDISREDFLNLNRCSGYPVSEALAAWRYDSLYQFPGALFLGIKDKNGQWLSLISGRCRPTSTTVEWQMNRANETTLSFITLLRSHLLEHEVSRGSRRIYFVGGTSHSINNSFVFEDFVDFIALPRSLPMWLLRRLVRPLMLEQTFLVKTLINPKLKWQRWQTDSPKEIQQRVEA